MNLVFIIGRIISDVNFKFTYKSDKNAVALFICQLNNGSLVKVQALDNNADYCYANLKLGDFVIIEGSINSKFIISVKNIKKL